MPIIFETRRFTALFVLMPTWYINSIYVIYTIDNFFEKCKKNYSLDETHRKERSGKGESGIKNKSKRVITFHFIARISERTVIQVATFSPSLSLSLSPPSIRDQNLPVAGEAFRAIHGNSSSNICQTEIQSGGGVRNNVENFLLGARATYDCKLTTAPVRHAGRVGIV